MINIIKSNDRYNANFGWLDARWHFSFSDYYDPKNEHFSVLRVYNDDVVQGGGGFPMHPHRDMEIVTYVIEGELAHADSMGNKEVIHPDEVQVMSAGSGVRHSEFNASKDKPVRLNQIWIMPRNRGATPRWDQRRFDITSQRDRLVPVVSDGSIPNTLSIDQDAIIEVGKISGQKRVTKSIKPGRSLYLFLIAGQAKVNARPLASGDQARITDETNIEMEFESDSHILAIDLP